MALESHQEQKRTSVVDLKGCDMWLSIILFGLNNPVLLSDSRQEEVEAWRLRAVTTSLRKVCGFTVVGAALEFHPECLQDPPGQSAINDAFCTKPCLRVDVASAG